MATGPRADSAVGRAGLVSRPAGPTVARVLLGGRLRVLREVRGITREAAAAEIRASASKISRLELGRTGFKRRDVADLLTLYGVTEDAERAALLALVEPARAPGWVHDYAELLPAGAETRLELEQASSLIRCYEPQFVPALLQTADYARAVSLLDDPDEPRGVVDRRIGLLAGRQEILSRPVPVELWAVIDEAVLRRRVGSAATMRAQLVHLVEMASLPHVSVQVMAFSTGVAAGGAITLMRFAEDELDDVVYLDQAGTMLQSDRPADACHYRKVLDRLSIRAEEPSETEAVLRRICTET